MAIPTYLAMTAAEFAGCKQLPHHPAWMACHFSPYSTGLSNFPSHVPEQSIIIVNDIMPIQKHDPQTVADQLTTLICHQSCSAVLLDFQRPVSDNSRAITQLLCEALPCPVGVSTNHAQELDCPVFLPLCPPHCSLESHIAPWQGREIWLEFGLGESDIYVDEKGMKITPSSHSESTEPGFQDTALCCHYKSMVGSNGVTFTLWQDPEDLKMLLKKAEQLGVSKAIGLYQEMKEIL